MRRTLTALALTITLATVVRAQAPAAPDTAARRAAMSKLAFLLGSWSGDAWAIVGRGERFPMRQTESVRYAVGGQVLLVEGVGRRLVNGAPADTVFHALGTIDWTPERGYLMRSYSNTGHHGEFPLQVTPTGFAWQLAVPGGTTRYRMVLTPEGAWDERGFFSRDTTDGFQTFGMVVKKQ